MNSNLAHEWKMVARGIALVALLAACPAMAGSPGGHTAGAMDASGKIAGPERTRSVQGLGSNDAFERRSFHTLSADQARPTSSGRVYLEDYQRVPQGVGQKYPTEPRVLGQNKRRSRN